MTNVSLIHKNMDLSISDYQEKITDKKEKFSLDVAIK